MSLTPHIDDVERFRAAISRRLGLQFDDGRAGFLGEVLHRRLKATKCGCDGYILRLEADRADEELAALAEELTVPETYFYRYLDQFRAFAELVLPERMRLRGSGGRLKLLSAGCASGEEAYTLAMIARETLPPTATATILGVDVNPAALRKAQLGRFSRWSLRETPPGAAKHWFTQQGREAVLDETIRGAVKFERRNLAVEDGELWAAETYDVVFCRNVIMYFAPERARALIARITRALAPGGYLFLGHAETLRGLSQDFHLCHTHGTFYYQRRPLTAATALPTRSAPLPSLGPASLASLVEETDTWVDAIQLATERVHRLTTAAGRRMAGGPSREAADARAPELWDLSRALELLREERFAEALELVEALPADASADPDVLLLHAVLLTHAGLLARAEQACLRLLAIDDLNAAAHYVLALCREGAGDIAGAVEHDRIAAYLDPHFAMARLHLGLLARRSGDLRAMRAELGQAASLLQGEDASRLLLFGSGFGREALVALCRAELAVSGAAA